MDNDLETPKKGLSRRQLIQRGLVIGGAIWVPPVVQSLRVPAMAATGSPAPCQQDTGFMTGSGSVNRSDGSGLTAQYDTGGSLQCVGNPAPNMRITWDNGLKGRNRVTYEFDLTSITSILCSANPGYPIGPNANFNETSGTGTGTYVVKVGNNTPTSQSGTISFDLIDGGEPGATNDHATLIVRDSSNNIVLTVSNEPLLNGNLQSHGNTAFGNACP